MKAQYIPIAELVLRQSPVWQKRMGLAHVEIENVFLDSFFGDDGEEDFKVTAVTEVRWQYDEAKIKWFLPSAIRKDEEQIEETLVHELCHVLLAPEQNLDLLEGHHDMVDAYLEAFLEKRELATERTARAIWRAWNRDAR